MYLLLVAFRENRSGVTLLSYERIIHYAGLSRNDVSRARSTLIGLDLISVQSGRFGSDNGSGFATGYNKYFVRGLGRVAFS